MNFLRGIVTVLYLLCDQHQYLSVFVDMYILHCYLLFLSVIVFLSVFFIASGLSRYYFFIFYFGVRVVSDDEVDDDRT